MRPFLALDVFPVSLPMFLSEFIFCLYVGSTCTFCFGGKFFLFTRSVSSAAIGRGAWRIPPFCLQPRVYESIFLFPQFSVVVESLEWATPLGVDSKSLSGAASRRWIAGLLTLLRCCCPRT